MEEKKIVRNNIIHGGDQNYYIPILLSLVVIISGPLLYIEMLPFDIAVVGALALLVFYLLRFNKKTTQTVMDKVKLLVIFFHGIAILEYTMIHAFADQFVFLSMLSFLTIYFIDRIILNAMKKFSIVLNIVLVLGSLFYIVWAQIQTNYAQEQQEISNELRMEAVALSEKAHIETANALEAQAEAERLAVELQLCQESK